MTAKKRTLTAPALLAIAGLATVASTSLPTPADAQYAVRRAVDACRDDYRRLCLDVVPGGGRIAACLIGQAEKLSPGCAEALAAVQDNMRQFFSTDPLRPHDRKPLD